ncbi:MAG TPA: galactose oxidase early set domain-containing protein, partial [Rugosimonospora sp.]|nr:galactose oxidase early set domain-containing protein [Rugosimonospora sp.]
FATPDPTRIAKVRLVRPSAATHNTNLEQRSIALPFTATDGGVEVTVPDQPTIVPPGFYMLFLVDQSGVPSVARWVQVP